MTELLRFRVGLNWDTGGPGVNTYYFSQGVPAPSSDEAWIDLAANDLADLMANMANWRVSSCTWVLEKSVDIIDVATGNIVRQLDHQLTDAFGQGTQAGTALSRAQQVYVRLLTDRWLGGRRLAGGTFIGPSGEDTVGNNGQMTLADKDNIADAFNAVTTGIGPRLAVYSRGQGQNGGTYGDVTAVRVRQTPGQLRSRRD